MADFLLGGVSQTNVINLQTTDILADAEFHKRQSNHVLTRKTLASGSVLHLKQISCPSLHPRLRFYQPRLMETV